jgi:hypothetical protein
MMPYSSKELLEGGERCCWCCISSLEGWSCTIQCLFLLLLLLLLLL